MLEIVTRSPDQRLKFSPGHYYKIKRFDLIIGVLERTDNVLTFNIYTSADGEITWFTDTIKTTLNYSSNCLEYDHVSKQYTDFFRSDFCTIERPKNEVIISGYDIHCESLRYESPPMFRELSKYWNFLN